jgi:hypothetical protein
MARLARVASASGLCAAAVAVATAVLGAALRPGYDACAQYISELGERGAPHAAWVSYAGFLPIGALTLLFCAAAAGLATSPRARLGLLLFSGVGWSYFVAALFPCDPGCPSAGSLSQQLHNASAFAEYLGGAAGLLVLHGAGAPLAASPARRRFTLAVALVAFVAFAAMLVFEPQRGLFQRVADGAYFLWIAAASLALRRARG